MLKEAILFFRKMGGIVVNRSEIIIGYLISG
jgi:hypothetical protein